MSGPLVGDVVNRLLEPDRTAAALLDAGQHVLERRLLGQALQLGGQVLLERLASLLRSPLERGVDIVWEVSNQDIRHAYIMIAVRREQGESTPGMGFGSAVLTAMRPGRGSSDRTGQMS